MTQPNTEAGDGRGFPIMITDRLGIDRRGGFVRPDSEAGWRLQRMRDWQRSRAAQLKGGAK